MKVMTFAEPLFLYLLVVIPVMIIFYILKQHKSTASLRMPGLQPFAGSFTTFRHYLRHLLFAFRTIAITILIFVLARPQATDKFQDISLILP